MFEDQIVWITGASSGIGEAMAHQFVSDGAKLVLSARRVNELERVKAELVKVGASTSDILVLPLDMTDEAAMPGAVETVVKEFGRVDFLYNNAGISQRSYCLETDMSTYRKLFEVDVFGQIALTKLVLPVMIAQGSGHLAVTASVAGKVGVKQRTGYCAAKHAMIGFFDALRAEMSENGIKVTVINPGFIKTNASKNAIAGDGSAYGKIDDDSAGGLDVNDFAARVMKKMKRGQPEILVGGRLETMAAWGRRLFPRYVFRLTAKRAGSS